MRKALCKVISMLLIVTLLLPIGVLAVGHYETFDLDNVEYLSAEPPITEETESDGTYDEDLESDYTEYMPELPKIEVSELAVMFDVYGTSGVAHVGYIFQLIENAVVSSEGNENIRVIFPPLNIFVADTLEDILDFVNPELILYIERDYII